MDGLVSETGGVGDSGAAGGEVGEPVWSNLKRSLANLVKQDINQLTTLVKTRLRRCSTGPASLRASWPNPDSTSHPFSNSASSRRCRSNCALVLMLPIGGLQALGSRDGLDQASTQNPAI